ncbi:hypothetical protein Cgig2_033749 [Carnegiea gigantea]|uniref:Uncharacterized protein n=1 Tax=Carnegiea gigantea TaxID=171969 RepID=A0A9Q1K1H9_9CARY|nr:hypothetical protein Cgig2_033749 [Carnegiea gigantea]
MTVINPGLLLKQYHPKSPGSLGAIWTVCTRLNARAEQLVHDYIRLGDYKGAPCRQEVLLLEGRPSYGSKRAGAPGNSGPSATISRTSPTGERPFLLSTNLPGVEGPSWDEELVDAPSEDECLDNLSEVEKEVHPEVELVVAEATSAPGFDELGAEQGLPCVPLANNSSGDLMQGADLVFAILCTWKSVIQSAMVISHGYETSASELRVLGVEEHSQLDHERVPGSKRGIA